jgi:hypothetical protein
MHDAGERGDAALDLAIKLIYLEGGFAIVHDGEIDGEDVGGIEWRAGLLEDEEGLHEYAGTGKKQE